MVDPSGTDQARQALERLLAPYGIASLGVIREDGRSWGTGARRAIPLTGAGMASVDHDEREAPFVAGPDGMPDDTWLVSLTDEGELRLCAWAHLEGPTRVRGIGVDLASTGDFAGERGARFNRLLFTGSELAWAEGRIAEDPLELSLAYAFSAKEAAFKSLAAPLRSWYRTHAEKLVFDLRDFELAGDRHEAGSARRGAAASAMDRMGIACIELGRTSLCGLALTFAVALGR